MQVTRPCLAPIAPRPALYPLSRVTANLRIKPLAELSLGSYMNEAFPPDRAHREGASMTFLSIAAGFVLLFAGGEAVVRGAVALANRFGVSPLVIGLTIVGFGTSLPELLVSLNAALSGAPGIAVGNVIGSNLANMMLVLGVAAVICPIVVNAPAIRRDAIAVVGVTMVFVLAGLSGLIGALEGGLMVALLLGYVGTSLWQDMHGNGSAAELHREEAEELTGLPQRVWLMVVWAVGGFAAVLYGAEILVSGATALAKSYQISDEVIGLTLVAVGTSLPELTVSIVAAYRGHSDVCIGNVLGSNIFNLFGILGVTALVTPVPFADKIIQFDLWVLLGVTVLLVPIILTGRRVTRSEAFLLLVLYGAYVACQFWGLGGTMPAHQA